MPEQQYAKQSTSNMSNITQQEEVELPLHSTDLSYPGGLQQATPKSDKGSLSPQNVLQLQSVIGNQAVVQLFRPNQTATQAPSMPKIAQTSASESVIQTARFKDNQAATEWLVGVLTNILSTKRAQIPANFTEDKMDTYLGNLSNAISGKLEALLKQHGGVYAEEKDFYKNLGTLYNPEIATNAVARIRAAESNRHFGAKKRTVGPGPLEHIFHGTVDNKEKPTSVTGYHWEGDDESVAIAYGAKTNVEGQYGLYQRHVCARKDPDVKKGNVSTFFPETWSKENIIAAIEYANDVGGRLEATFPSKARGLKMVINDAGFFPDAPENQ